MTQCYCETVKNVTVAIDDEIYRRARIRAAEQGTSVSAMVAAYLRDLSAGDEFSVKEALQDRVLSEITAFRASDRLPRDEVHDRAVR